MKPTDRSRRSYLIEYLNNPINRRSALKLFGAGIASVYFPSCASLSPRGSAYRNLASSEAPLLTPEGLDFSPIDRTLGALAPRQFSGDNPDRSHGILWDKANYLASRGGKIPEPDEKVPLVIVGGGVSGSMTAYLLKKYNPIILERAQRFGGNARGESWNGLDYSIGAAYFMGQDEGSPLQKLYAELGIDKMYRVKSVDDPVVYNEKRYDTFWEGSTAPGHEEQFKKLQTYFKNMLQNQGGLQFPDIPVTDASKLDWIKSLDQVSFKNHLESVVGGALHPHIETAMEHYCWSSFGARFGEIGAASGLNFYAAEFGDVYITPGGNSAICERILQRTLLSVPASHFRPNTVVLDANVVSDGVIIGYEDPSGKLRSIHAQAAVLACPKFVVARILNGIEPERIEAIRQLRYHSYLVANVLLDQAVPDTFYDLFMIGDGTTDAHHVPESVDKQKVTDIVLGTFAHVDPSRSILTLYRAIPYEGARQLLYADGAYSKYRTEFGRQIAGEVLPLVGVGENKVRDLRLTRWGHPLPVAARGLIANGVIDQIRKPFRDRVFFIEQDNWMLPAFETGTTEAVTFAPQIENLLKKA